MLRGGRTHYQVTLSAVEEKVKSRELKGFKSLRDNYPKCLLSMDIVRKKESNLKIL
ncbi:MAG: hypothetical protein JEZ08_03600 [Clostridiales bacterium]|nr:hypothetical protein [Clostridiales bacterium]